ncbi:MAG: abortive infection family protein [Pseudomonadota bacterium]
MLCQTLESLELQFDEENDGCIDAAKALVECACQVLIAELDDPSNPIKGWKDSPIQSEQPSFKDWISAAFRLMRLVESKADPFSKVISQHYKMTDALGEFRNAAGPLSHGKDGFAQRLSAHHRRSALLAADALVTFLHNAYLENTPDPVRTLEPYERFSAANEKIDYASAFHVISYENGSLDLEILIGEDERIPLSITPSQLLFGVDREAYKLAQNTTASVEIVPEEVEE